MVPSQRCSPHLPIHWLHWHFSAWERNHSQVLRGAKGSTPLVSWAAAVGQAVLSQRWLPGVHPAGQEGEQTGKCWKSSLSRWQHATLQRRYRFFHSHPPCSLQAAVELKHPCKEQMTAQACSSRAACVSVQQCWCSQVTTAPGIAVRPLAALLTPAPAASARHTRCWKQWLHLSLRPCTLTSGVRRQNGILGVFV